MQLVDDKESLSKMIRILNEELFADAAITSTDITAPRIITPIMSDPDTALQIHVIKAGTDEKTDTLLSDSSSIRGEREQLGNSSTLKAGGINSEPALSSKDLQSEDSVALRVASALCKDSAIRRTQHR
jgi:hypothetical protein